MAYVNPNYPSKKAFKEAIASGVKHRPYSPSGIFPQKQNGTDLIEGPHYPKPHRWYCAVVLTDGVVTKAEGAILPTAAEIDRRKAEYLAGIFTVGAVLDFKG